MSILVRIGSASLGKTSTGAGPETQPERMNLDERMVLRREMAFQVVRYVIGEWGLPEASFRFKVVPLDPRGHIFSVMIDLPVQFMADLAISQRELQRLGDLIDLAARKRFNLRVPSVYWRVSESLAVDFSDQAGTRQILPGACRIVEQGDSAAHARVAAVERSLVHGVAVRVDGRLYDTDLSPLTPESQNKRER